MLFFFVHILEANKTAKYYYKTRNRFYETFYRSVVVFFSSCYSLIVYTVPWLFELACTLSMVFLLIVLRYTSTTNDIETIDIIGRRQSKDDDHHGQRSFLTMMGQFRNVVCCSVTPLFCAVPFECAHMCADFLGWIFVTFRILKCVCMCIMWTFVVYYYIIRFGNPANRSQVGRSLRKLELPQNQTNKQVHTGVPHHTVKNIYIHCTQYYVCI